MKIIQAAFLDLLNERVQFRIPIYQRKYDWEKKNCIKLLDDIIDIAQDNKRDQHFVGSIIYKPEEEATNVSNIRVNYLIDGQQRLTTLMLILWAIGHYAKSVMDPDSYASSDYSLEAISEDHIRNLERHKGTDRYYKLMPIGDDGDAFKALMEDLPVPTYIASSRVYDNYQCILKHLDEKKLEPSIIFEGIRKLVIADICLEHRDNPQVLFEIVNSTGKELKSVDKVRNFILMNAGMEVQDNLYKNHWQPMEQRLAATKDGLNDFFRCYAEVITENKTPNDYYDYFKDHYLGIDSIRLQREVEDMDDYSILYRRWLDSDFGKTDTDLLLFRLKNTGQDKCIPVVLKILRNIDLKIMTVSDANQALKILESYIIRREMCGLKTNTIGEAFIKILRVSDSLDNIRNCIVNNLTDKQRMPNDTELKQALKTVDFYGLPRAHYILDIIEKHLNPAYMPDHSKVSIEHIMPQKIESSDELYRRSDYSQQEKEDRDWAKDLGTNWQETHTKYCNTLGNLTLTGYNTHLGNCRFIVKRDMQQVANDGIIYGYSASAIRLSHGLRTLTKWGEEEILQRLDNIFGYISQIWPYPRITH